MSEKPKFKLQVTFDIDGENIWLEPIANKATGKTSWAITGGAGYLTDKFKWSREQEWYSHETKNLDPSIYLSLDEAKARATTYLDLKRQFETKASKEEIQSTIELLASAGYVTRNNDYRWGIDSKDLNHTYVIEDSFIFQRLYTAIAQKLPSLCPGASLQLYSGGHATAKSAWTLFISLPSETAQSAEKVSTIAKLIRRTLRPFKNLLVFAWNAELFAFSVHIQTADFRKSKSVEPFDL